MGDRGALLTRTIQIGFLLALFAAWYVVTAENWAYGLFLPPLAKVWAQLQITYRSGLLWSQSKVTLLEIVKAYAISASSGLVVGCLVSRSARMVRLMEPLFSGAFTIPLILFFPLFVYYFGIGPASKVAFGASYSFFPIVINSIAGFTRVEQLYLVAARSMGASTLQMFRRVYLPGALPVIVTGLRIGFIICVGSTLGGETLTSASGVGFNIAHSAELMDIARMYSWIVCVVLVSFTVNILISAVETRFTRD